MCGPSHRAAHHIQISFSSMLFLNSTLSSTCKVCNVKTLHHSKHSDRGPAAVVIPVQALKPDCDKGNTLQLRSAVDNLAAKAFACLPTAAVRPSGLVSVLPSIGASPSLATAKYTSTCWQGQCTLASDMPWCVQAMVLYKAQLRLAATMQRMPVCCRRGPSRLATAAACRSE